MHRKAVQAKEDLTDAVRARHARVIARHAKLVAEHDRLVGDLREAVREAPWATPLTVDSSITLPTLDELFAKPKTVWSNGLVVQDIFAHRAPFPTSARQVAASRSLTTLKRLLPSADALSTGQAPTTYSKPNGAFECEHGLCRLCPEFSTFYGHRVYICKRPVSAMA